MAEKVNYIGAEYRASFESVIKLVASGCLAGSDLDLAVDGTGSAVRIVDRKANSAFVCGRSARRAEESPLAMGEDGATWFGALRGEKREFPNSAWLALIDKVATAYHKKYSLVEYRQRKRTHEEESAINEYGRQVMQRLLANFYPRLAGKCRAAVPKEGSGDDIYGLSLRLGLSGGTGEAQPVLCRVYFRRLGNRLYPIERVAASQIETYISEAVLAADAAAERPSDRVDSTLIDASLNALGELINPRSGVSRFSACVCFPKHPGETESRDEKIIEDLSKKMLNAQKTIECKSVKVLGITHVRWESTVLDVMREGKRAFRLTFGPNKTISMRCMNCSDDTAIIENNVVTYTDEQGAHEVAIDPLKDDLGLDKDTVAMLREKVFSDHLGAVSCSVRGTQCERLVCRSQTTEFGKEIRKCTNCPYPEIVWTDEKEVARYTPDLAFALDKRELIPKKEADVCVYCGRSFSKSLIDAQFAVHGERACPFCADAIAGEGESAVRAAKNYGKYAGVLPVGVRLAAFGKKKYCYEDDGILFFVIGKYGYRLDKMEIGDVGYLARVKKVGRVK